MVMTAANVCDVCNVKVCCSKKNCACWFTVSDLAVKFREQQIEKNEDLQSIVKKKIEAGEVNAKILMQDRMRCPNPRCEYKRYHCKKWCLTDPKFDMSIYQ